MRILLSAFACSPGVGSEEGVGWGVMVNLARRKHRVHVLTTPRSRAGIERDLPEDVRAQLSFSYFDFPRPLLRVIVTSALWQVYYYFWQLRLAAWAQAEVERFDPQVLHHVTYGRYWMPSSLWKLGRPFVWGPLGGGDDCPPAFHSCLTWRGRWSDRARRAVRTVAHADPNLKATARHAAVALAGTPETEVQLTRLGCTRTRLLLCNGIDSDLVAARQTVPREDALFCCVGRLLDWKGQSLALRAFAAAAIPGSKLAMIGRGPARGALERLTRKLGLGSQVTFRSDLSRSEVIEWMGRSVALVHPALHDQAPTVAFEAMAVGTPVIALALGGIKLQVDAECAILIEARNPDQATAELAQAMRRIVRDPELRRDMGAAGKRRLEAQFTWSKKAEEYESIYESVIAEGKYPGPSRHPVGIGARVKVPSQGA